LASQRTQASGTGPGEGLLSTVLSRMVELGHVRATLDTNTLRTVAVGLYLKFGFVPDIRTEQDRQAWLSVRDDLPESPLAEMDLG